MHEPCQPLDLEKFDYPRTCGTTNFGCSRNGSEEAAVSTRPRPSKRHLAVSPSQRAGRPLMGHVSRACSVPRKAQKTDVALCVTVSFLLCLFYAQRYTFIMENQQVRMETFFNTAPRKRSPPSFGFVRSDSRNSGISRATVPRVSAFFHIQIWLVRRVRFNFQITISALKPKV